MSVKKSIISIIKEARHNDGLKLIAVLIFTYFVWKKGEPEYLYAILGAGIGYFFGALYAYWNILTDIKREISD